MGTQQEQQGELRQWDEEAHWLSLDADPKYLAWLEYENARLRFFVDESAAIRG